MYVLLLSSSSDLDALKHILGKRGGEFVTPVSPSISLSLERDDPPRHFLSFVEYPESWNHIYRPLFFFSTFVLAICMCSFPSPPSFPRQDVRPVPSLPRPIAHSSSTSITVRGGGRRGGGGAERGSGGRGRSLSLPRHPRPPYLIVLMCIPPRSIPPFLLFSPTSNPNTCGKSTHRSTTTHVPTERQFP